MHAIVPRCFPAPPVGLWPTDPPRANLPSGTIAGLMVTLADIDAWFGDQGWAPFEFQREVWSALGSGGSGLLHATTGSGKTYAVWMGALLRATPHTGLQVLWLTPMRALAADTVRALQHTVAGLAPGWSVGLRTGDTGSAERAHTARPGFQRRRRW